MSQTSFNFVDNSRDSEDNSESESKIHVLSVSELNKAIKGVLEDCFENFWLKAEVSNFKAHTSGHWYFSLKDKNSQASAVMFRGQNARLKFRPETGMEVLVRGRVSVYEPRGNYQIYVEYMEPAGVGALQQAFEQLKGKLKKQGLFEQKHKKPIPPLPKHIAVITSPTGAAVRDIINVISRRYRSAQVTVVPALVQGDRAAASIVQAIEMAQKIKDLDVMIVGRGGGSMEDMWCFNEESVARSIFNCPVPIISAVGHEVDFTISDFVADLRAPTPSAAAELVAKNANDLMDRLKTSEKRLIHMVAVKLREVRGHFTQLNKRLIDPRRSLEEISQRLDELSTRLERSTKQYFQQKRMQVNLVKQSLVDPSKTIQIFRQRLSMLSEKNYAQVKNGLLQSKNQWQRLSQLLDSLSPLKVVDRGYSITLKNKKVVKSIGQVSAGDTLVIKVSDGEINTTVNASK